MERKEFELPKRDGTKVKIVFEKTEGVWFWDLPDGKSLLLPDVELKTAKTLKDCLDLIAEKRDDEWVGLAISECLKV